MLGCVDLDVAFALPANVIAENLEKLNRSETKKGPGHYYQVKIVEPGPGSYGLQLPRNGRNASARSLHVTAELAHARIETKKVVTSCPSCLSNRLLAVQKVADPSSFSLSFSGSGFTGFL